MRVIYRLHTENMKGVAEEAKWAEDIGYDGLSSPETAHDPFLPLMLAAAATERVTLETRVAIAFPRSPMVTAYASRDLHDFSDGRFQLGIGTQVKGHNLRRFSVESWRSPGKRLKEYVESVKAIWDNWQNGGKLDYHGEFYNFTLMTPFFSPGPSEFPDPRVYIGAVNGFNCRVAGEVCDGLMLHSLNSKRYLNEFIVPNVESGAKKAGKDLKDVRISGGGFIITGPSQADVDAKRQGVKRQISFYASTRTYFPVLEVHGFQDIGQRLHEMSLRGEWDDMPGQVSDEMLDTFAIMGDYEDIAGKIKERYGDLLDSVSFTMETKTRDDEQILKRILAELKSE